jgi:hypothetical protein
MGLRPSGLSRLTQAPFRDYYLPPLRRAVPLAGRLCEDLQLLVAGHEFKVPQVKEKFGGLRFYVRLDGLRLSHADDANPGLALPWKNPSIPVRLRPAGGTAGRTFD